MVQTEVFAQTDSASTATQPAKSSNSMAVLEELFVLLEDYAPAWYTAEHHNRALAALLGRES